MKESHPIETAKFAKSKEIDRESAFKRDAIITSVTLRLKKSTHKYGIEVPTSVKHARAIDKKNNNHLWMEALGNGKRWCCL